VISEAGSGRGDVAVVSELFSVYPSTKLCDENEAQRSERLNERLIMLLRLFHHNYYKLRLMSIPQAKRLLPHQKLNLHLFLVLFREDISPM